MKQRTKKISQRPASRRMRLHPVALSVMCVGMGPALALAQAYVPVLPSFQPGGYNVRGVVNVAPTTTPTPLGGQALAITQGSARAIINWTNFSIGSKDAVNIQQAMGSSSVLLNRVTGAQASNIAGSLTANGHVFLVNPNGIVFAKGAQVNVGGLVASTLNIADSSFMPDGSENRLLGRGDQFLFADASGKLAQVKVENGASIATNAPGGVVALLGGAVRNDGDINVARGSIGLVSATKVTLDFEGDGLTTFKIPLDGQTPFKLADVQAVDPTAKAQLVNSGNLTADGGRVVLMTAAADADARQLVVSQTGVVRARSLSSRNGEIVLDAGGSPTGTSEMAIGGRLDAKGSEAGVAGGSITARADYVRLVPDATLDASGSQGGKVTVTGTAAVSMAPAATIRADATGANGNGGSVNLDASFVHVSGQVTANGAGSGNGGVVSTSAELLEVTDQARIEASGGATGANGRWVATSRADIYVIPDVPAYDPLDYRQNSAVTRLGPGAIGRALGRATDVNLRTDAPTDSRQGNVYFDEGPQIVKSEGRTSRLTVDAQRDIRMLDGASIQSTSGALHVDFDANASGDKSGGIIRLRGSRIETNGGDIRFYGQGDPVGGRAVGGTAYSDGGPQRSVEGVVLTDSVLSTCAMASGQCGGTGAISLRGSGTSNELSGDPAYQVTAGGVRIEGSKLSTGAGNIAIDGQGAIGATGVRITGTANGASTIQSGTGNISVVGSSRSWTNGDAPAIYADVLTFNDSTGLYDATMSSGTGVSINGATLGTGGRVNIDGTGGDLQGLSAQAEFQRAAANQGPNGLTVAQGSGVVIGSSSITAGKGQQVSISGTAGSAGFTVKNQAGAPTVIAGADADAVNIALPDGKSIQAEGGRIAIDGRGGDVRLSRYDPRIVSFGAQQAVAVPPAVLNVASSSGAGGSISMRGRNVLIDDAFTSPTLDASGAGKGGSIDIQASKSIAIGPRASLVADAASTTGNGGSVRVVAGDTLRGYGRLSARGGSGGGNGGSIETSAPHFDLRGLRADASAPMGSAGSWVIDPFNVDIIGGVATGSLTGNPFDPLANSVIQDGDINAALNAGTSVTIGTGTGGLATDGDIYMHDAGFLGSKTAVNINYSADKGPVTFRLDANRSVRGDRNVVIQSTGKGALNVVFNADANNGGLATGGGQVSYSGNIFTNGGDVTMKGQWANASNQNYSVHLDGDFIDTRVGRSDAGAGGAVNIVGNSIGPRVGFPAQAVGIDGVQISTSTGDVNITGTASMTTGVGLGSRFIATGTANRQTVITTTTGNIKVVGVGNNTGSSNGAAPGHGVVIQEAALRSIDGNITVRGVRQAGGTFVGDGVRLTNGTQIVTSGAGNIELTGQSEGNGAGVRIGPVAPLGGAFPPVNATVDVAAGGNLLLRASNDSSTDALVVAGTAKAGGVVNLRPGGVDAAGNAFDQTATPITLGGTAATGFAVSADEFTRIAAGSTIVVGSNTHAGDINVVGPLSLPSALTLQNGGGGNIQLGGAITTSQLGLVSAGNIGQAAGAAISANTLLARSSGGSVVLDNAANNVGTVGGGAAGQFTYVDADALTIAPVAVTGINAADNTPQLLAATSMAADRVLVRTMSQDLTLNTSLSSGSGADLVAAARFQNPGGGTLGGAAWRVWADTWVGETRGGLRGSGLLPNLYHCAYLGLCAVSVPAGANHFIYAQQPVATVVIGNASRPFGFPNPLFSYLIGGLILGDTGAGFSGTAGTSATQASLPGLYPITGSFTSAEGYAVNVVPGNLRVTARADLPSPDVLRDMPSTWLYDRNIGTPPICFAADTDGTPAAQGGDLLAREWTRVRSRPNLSSCVDTEKRNGCSDF